ncbi:unnamed protein product [Ixodes hexagonus]
MPTNCVAFGCRSWHRPGDGKRFFQFPSENLFASRRAAWIRAVKRVHPSNPTKAWQPSKQSRICGDHFVTGEPSLDNSHPDYVPTVFSYAKKPASRHVGKSNAATVYLPFHQYCLRRLQLHRLYQKTDTGPSDGPSSCQRSAGSSSANSWTLCSSSRQRSAGGSSANSRILYSSNPTRSTSRRHGATMGPSVMSQTCERCKLQDVKTAQLQQRNLLLEFKLKRSELEVQHLKACQLTVDTIRHKPKKCMYYTGLPEYGVFKAFYDFLAPRAAVMKYWKCNERTKEMKGRPREMELIEEFFMVLVRLRTGMAGKEMARNFGVSEGTLSKVFTTWMNFLQRELKALTRFPSLHEVQENLPHAFRNFPNTRVVLDGTEVRIQRPSSLVAQRQTFSPYKHFNTYKAVIGCTPDGYISHVSDLWGGSVSDRLIVEQSGLMGLLEPGDAIMVDKGFRLNDLPPGVQVHIPAFRKPQEPQMSEEDVAHTRQVASARVIVERVIGRVKQFHIFDRPFPITMIDIADQIFQVCCFLSNFREPLTNDD